MDTTANTYYHFFQQHLPSLSGQRLGVSVSGGVDSMALLHLSSRFSNCFGYRVSAIHFNHGLRSQSREEEASVVSYCESLQIPCTVHTFLPDDWKQAPGTGMEEKARELRARVFQTLISEQSVDWILLGHSQDDWTETVLFHFIRGCSPSHLSDALKAVDRNRKILRPLLTVPKSKLIEYAHHFHLPTHEDETNLDTTYSRNKIRHQILPLIQAINPNFNEALDHFTRILKSEETILEQETINAWHNLVKTDEPAYLCLDKTLWKKQNPAIQLRLLRKIREHLSGNRRDFYYSQLISVQMGIMTMVHFHFEDKMMRIDCTEDCIKARKRG